MKIQDLTLKQFIEYCDPMHDSLNVQTIEITFNQGIPRIIVNYINDQDMTASEVFYGIEEVNKDLYNILVTPTPEQKALAGYLEDIKLKNARTSLNDDELWVEVDGYLDIDGLPYELKFKQENYKNIKKLEEIM